MSVKNSSSAQPAHTAQSATSSLPRKLQHESANGVSPVPDTALWEVLMRLV